MQWRTPIVLCVLLAIFCPRMAFADLARVIDDRSTIWSAINGIGNALSIVRTGTELKIRRRQGDWLVVELPFDPSRQGYILAFQVEVIPEAERETKAPEPAAVVSKAGATEIPSRE